MLLVHVAEPGKKASEFRHQAVGRRRVHAVSFLDRNGVLRRKRDDQVAREQVIDVGGNCELGLAQRKAATPGADIAAWRKPGDPELLGVLRQVGVSSLQHRGDRGIERRDAATRRHRGRSLRRHGGAGAAGCTRLGLLEALFERLQTRFVGFANLPDLLADFRDLGVGCRVQRCRERECQCQGKRARHQIWLDHVNLL